MEVEFVADDYMLDNNNDNNHAFEFDFDYEFDAARFFDFSRAESHSEAREAESWFCSAGSYPPSPFIIKFKWREETYRENAKASFKSSAGESTISSSKYDMSPNVLESYGIKEGSKYMDEMSEETPKAKVKSAGNSSGVRISTLMKPTASHLAKLKPASETSSSQSFGRSPKSVNGLSERCSRSPLTIYVDATKRQKLEDGYLCKVARLKHQNMLLHKLSKVPRVVANTVNSRVKTTIPKEPDLETAHRAQRHRNNSESSANAKLKTPPSKSGSMSRKILKTLLQPQKTNGQQSSVLQTHNIQISEPLSTNGATDIKRPKYGGSSKQEQREPAKRITNRSLRKQNDTSTNELRARQIVKAEDAATKLEHATKNESSFDPPTELFKKLSLKSELESNGTCRSKQRLNSKVPKENFPNSYRREISVS